VHQVGFIYKTIRLALCIIRVVSGKCIFVQRCNGMHRLRYGVAQRSFLVQLFCQYESAEKHRSKFRSLGDECLENVWTNRYKIVTAATVKDIDISSFEWTWSACNMTLWNKSDTTSARGYNSFRRRKNSRESTTSSALRWVHSVWGATFSASAVALGSFR
jgi:hypothetical protein